MKIKQLALLILVLANVTAIAAPQVEDLTPVNNPIVPATIGTQKWASDGKRDVLLNNAAAFLGELTGSFVNIPQSEENTKSTRTKVITQFNLAFAGNPYPEITFSDGNSLYAASAPHDAQTKGMIVTKGSSDDILAIALLHQNCGRNNGRDKQDVNVPIQHSCDVQPQLTIIYRSHADRNHEVNVQLAKWVNDQLATSNKATSKFPVLKKTKFRVQIRDVE